MFSLLQDELRLHVDHCAPNSSGRLNRQVKVLNFVVHIGAMEVDCSWGNGWHLAEDCSIDEFTE